LVWNLHQQRSRENGEKLQGTVHRLKCLLLFVCLFVFSALFAVESFRPIAGLFATA